MATKVGNIFVELGLDYRSMTQGLSSAARRLKEFAGMKMGGPSMGGVFGGMVAFEGLKASLGGAASMMSSVKSFMDQSAMGASDLNEQISSTRVQLGGVADEAIQFAKTMQAAGQQSMGETLMGITAITEALKKEGLQEDAAIEKAKELSQRFADLGSQRNMAGSEVQDKFMSMMRGEMDPVEDPRLNVKANAEMLKATGKPFGLAAADEFLRQTASAQGDFANTSLSLANLGRQNQTARAGVMSQVGEAISPAYQAAEWFQNQFLKKFSDAIAGRLGQAGDSIFSGINSIGTTILEWTPWIADKFLQFGNFIGDTMRLIGSMLRSPGEYLGIVIREIGVSLIDIIQKVFPSAMAATEATLKEGIDRNKRSIAETDAAAMAGEKDLMARLEAGSQGKAPDPQATMLAASVGGAAAKASDKSRTSSFGDYFKGIFANGTGENPQKQQVELAKSMDSKLGVIAAAVAGGQVPGTKPIGSAVAGVL